MNTSPHNADTPSDTSKSSSGAPAITAPHVATAEGKAPAVGDSPAAVAAEPNKGPAKPQSLCVVVGDIQRDTILVTRPLETMGGQSEAPCPGTDEPPLIRVTRDGGVWLLHDTIRHACRDVKQFAYVTYAGYEQLTTPHKELCPESLVRLDPFKKEPNSKAKDVVYRIKDDLGWVESPSRRNDHEKMEEVKTELGKAFEALLKSVTSDVATDTKPNVVVIYDRAHQLRPCGFRHAAASQAFAKLIDGNDHFKPDGDGVIVWNRTFPLELESDLVWQGIVAAKCENRTVAVVKYDCLARTGVRINQDSSVERLIEDCVRQQWHPVLLQFRKCRHLLLIFRDGTLHWDNQKQGSVEYHCCPNSIDERLKPRLGKMSGTTITMVASVVLGLTSEPAVMPFNALDDLEKAVRLGTVLATQLYRKGFATRKLYDKTPELSDGHQLPFFLRSLFTDPAKENSEDDDGRVVTKRDYLLTTLKCPIRLADERRLSRTAIFFESLSERTPAVDAYDKITEVVCKGVEAATRTRATYGANTPWFPQSEVGCPFASFGAQQTIDRYEIENYMAIYNLISNYLDDKTIDKPFSIATFGTPGSGKSFAIKEIVNSIDPSAARTPLEFNVAQFTGVKDLAAVFHQAHDRSMLGGVSLVILDEFDSSFGNEVLGWLKFFLAPMQDGMFRDESNTYHVGRAILLFTGGTTSTFEKFYTDRKHTDDFRAAKGPDFVSRLRGYMNIPKFSSERDVDQATQLRRAMILRSILQRKMKRIIDPGTQVARIDRKVINAFLKTSKYEHEIRSMEAIVEMSKVDDGEFRQASLPTREQLSLHVDAKEFLGHLEDH